MIIAAIVFLIPILVIFLYYNYVRKYKDIENLPGPSVWDIIDFYRSKSSNGIVDFFQNLTKIYGPIVKIWIKPFAPVIITTDMEFIDKIYKSNDLFYTPSFGVVESAFRNGIATTKSRELWRNDKQIIVKALSPGAIQSHMKVYDIKFDDFIKNIKENLGNVIDIESILYRLLTEGAIESFNDPLVKLSKRELDEYIASKCAHMNLAVEKMNSLKMIGVLHKFTENYKQSLEHSKKIIHVAEELLKRHKSIPKEQREKYNLIYALIQSGMPEDRIVDNINTLISGAFETSVTLLGCAVHELGKRPDIQQKILEEVHSIVGYSSSKSITLNDLNGMTYLSCVVKESLRLFFTSPFLDRLLLEDVNVKNMTIPKNTQVMFQIPEILKSGENFKNSNVFIPERFLPENFDENARRAYLPFGFGLKTCPGKTLGLATMKLFIAKIIREFEICSAGNDGDIKLKPGVTFRSVNGVHVVFKKRNE